MKKFFIGVLFFALAVSPAALAEEKAKEPEKPQMSEEVKELKIQLKECQLRMVQLEMQLMNERFPNLQKQQAILRAEINNLRAYHVDARKKKGESE